MTETTRAIILAAGASTRMGRPKALLRVDGQTLLERAVEQARKAGAEPLVVLGADAERIRPHVGDIQVLVNPNWQSGMGTSIAWGISALSGQTERALIVAVDQPNVDAELLAELVDACDDTVDAAATRYANGVVGVPACFGRACFEALRALDADRGARDLLRSDEFEVAEVPTADAGVDVDTPEQWRAFQESQEA
ncbi:nucleotidyltransferase family protein [Persicimonas caeni]|uniref:Nucleotidyltransferase family protein n=1 Tax=Persicimonas caeni TaxID=2292766 RepID=A0A4Y6PNI7_PERCE|nr:nucleotidyltransferase family protein [Persicimonas caeni]QDG49375.1 nucleotidyltransferase family protein [Persicimonas caeni]QED30596.1 nucleotidyltransferase family protein [Persicimonas caeni]